MMAELAVPFNTPGRRTLNADYTVGPLGPGSLLGSEVCPNADQLMLLEDGFGYTWACARRGSHVP